MTGYFRYLILTIVCVITSGCVTVAVPPEKLDSIKTVAVVPLFEDVIHYNYFGLFVFMNEHETAPIADWKLDDAAMDEARKALSPRFSVMTAAVKDRSQVSPQDQYESETALLNRIFAAIDTGPETPDAFIFLIPEKNFNIGVNFYYPITGIALHYRGRFRGPWNRFPPFDLYNIYTIYVVDGKSHTVIAKRMAQSLEDGSYFNVPKVSLEEGWQWPDKLEPVMAAHGEDVRRHAEALLRQSLRKTLSSMGLTSNP